MTPFSLLKPGAYERTFVGARRGVPLRRHRDFKAPLCTSARVAQGGGADKRAEGLNMEMYLDGKWVGSPKLTEVVSPYSREVIDTIPDATPQQIEATLAAAVQGAAAMAKLTAYERSQILLRAADLLATTSRGYRPHHQPGRRQAAVRIAGRGRADSRHLPLVRVRGSATSGRNPAPGCAGRNGRQNGIHPARSLRHRGGHHPVQLSAAAGGP